MSQPLRIEDSEEFNFITSRTQNSRMWFHNHAQLEHDMLGALAKYSQNRNVKLYACNIQANHPHLVAQYPEMNRAEFMRDFNSRIAWLTKHHIPEVGRGKFWERRYSSQVLPRNEDIENSFFYSALQEVKSGLVQRIGEYPGYNSFNDAVSGIERKFKVVNWTDYNNAKRSNPLVSIRDYTKVYTLKYERLPGYEHLSQREYKLLMHKKLEERRVELVRQRLAEGKGFLGRDAIMKMKRGAIPRNSKQSTRDSKRPLVLTSCKKTRHEYLNKYFAIRDQHKRASEKFLSGQLDVEFPFGTYRPPFLTPIMASG